MNNLKKERGKYVSRATYQKVVEENRKLLRDMAVIVQDGINPDSIILKIEYRKKFKQQRMFTKLLKEYAQIYFKNNPHLHTFKRE